MPGSDIAEESARGSFIILFGNVLAAGISAGGTILITRLLGPDSYGIFTLVFVVPSLFQLFTGLGMATAVTRFVAAHLAKGEVERAKKITERTLIFVVTLGVALSAAAYATGPFLANYILGRSSLGIYVQLAALIILSQTICDAATSALIGWNAISRAAFLYLLQATTKLVIAPALILIGFGVSGAVAGQVISFAAEGIAGILLLRSLMSFGGRNDITGFVADIKSLLKYGLPAYFSGLLTGFAARFVIIILAVIAVNVTIGFFQAAENVIMVLSILSSSVGSILFRSYSSIEGKGGDLRVAFDYGVRYVSFILTPAIFLFIGSAPLLVRVLYGPFYGGTVQMLQLLAAASLTMTIGQTVLPSFLLGAGKSLYTLFTGTMASLSLVMGLVVFGVIFDLGVIGVIAALFVSHIIETASGLWISRRYLKASLSPRPLAGIVTSGFIALIAIAAVPTGSINQYVLLGAEIVAFALIYFGMVPILGGLDGDDIARLDNSLKGVGPLRLPLSLFFSYERKIFRAIKRVRKEQDATSGA